MQVSPEGSRRGLRTITIGPPTVGKSSLVARACGAGITGIVSTTQLDIQKKVVILPGGNTVELEIWDTAGQETYRSLNQVYYRSAKVALACFDAGNISNIEDWIKELRAIEPQCYIVLVLTKTDLMGEEEMDAVREEAAGMIKNGIGNRFFATSAVQNQGVDELFDGVAELVEQMPERREDSGVHRGKEPEKSGCPC
jgi:small GTP-binding protein